VLRPASAARCGALSGAAALYLFLAYFTRSVPLGGIDGTQAILTLVALAVPFALIVGAHVVYARILLAFAKSD